MRARYDGKLKRINGLRRNRFSQVQFCTYHTKCNDSKKSAPVPSHRKLLLLLTWTYGHNSRWVYGRTLSFAMPHGPEQSPLPRSTNWNLKLFFLSRQFCAKSPSVCHDFAFPPGPMLMPSWSICLGPFRRMWPMNFQRRRKICSLMVLMLARFRISSFDVFIGQ